MLLRELTEELKQRQIHLTCHLTSDYWCDQQESNLHLILRRNLIYPLIYGHTRGKTDILPP